MITQNEKYGCGLYAVMNALHLTEFLTEERLEISKGGNNIGQLSKWLQDDGSEIYIQPLYYDSFGSELPELSTTFIPQTENKDIQLPVLISVKETKESLPHTIAGNINNEGILILYDSLKEKEIETELSQLNKLYKEVYGIFAFADLYSENYVILGKKKKKPDSRTSKKQ